MLNVGLSNAEVAACVPLSLCLPASGRNKTLTPRVSAHFLPAPQSAPARPRLVVPRARAPVRPVRPALLPLGDGQEKDGPAPRLALQAQEARPRGGGEDGGEGVVHGGGGALLSLSVSISYWSSEGRAEDTELTLEDDVNRRGTLRTRRRARSPPLRASQPRGSPPPHRRRDQAAERARSTAPRCASSRCLSRLRRPRARARASATGRALSVRTSSRASGATTRRSGCGGTRSSSMGSCVSNFSRSLPQGGRAKERLTGIDGRFRSSITRRATPRRPRRSRRSALRRGPAQARARARSPRARGRPRPSLRPPWRRRSGPRQRTTTRLWPRRLRQGNRESGRKGGQSRSSRGSRASLGWSRERVWGCKCRLSPLADRLSKRSGEHGDNEVRSPLERRSGTWNGGRRAPFIAASASRTPPS